MKILPQDLIGKKVKDCYEHDGKIVIEFNDDTKIAFQIPYEKFYSNFNRAVINQYLDLKLC